MLQNYKLNCLFTVLLVLLSLLSVTVSLLLSPSCYEHWVLESIGPSTIIQPGNVISVATSFVAGPIPGRIHSAWVINYIRVMIMSAYVGGWNPRHFYHSPLYYLISVFYLFQCILFDFYFPS